jgi:hypothetical protein
VLEEVTLTPGYKHNLNHYKVTEVEVVFTGRTTLQLRWQISPLGWTIGAAHIV